MKEQIDKYKVEDLVKRRDEKQESARQRNKENYQDFKDKIRYLQKKDADRNRLLAELKAAHHEDNQ